MAITDFFISSAEVTRQTRTVANQDAVGSYDPSTTIVHAALACRVNPLSSKEMALFGKDDSVITHKIYCAADAGIQPEDEFAVDGLVLRVHGVRDIDLWGRFLTIEATSRDSDRTDI